MAIFSKENKEKMAKATALSLVGVGVGVAAFFTGGVGAVAIAGAKPTADELAKWLVDTVMADGKTTEKKIALLEVCKKEIDKLGFDEDEEITEGTLSDPVWVRYHAHRLDVTRKVLVDYLTALQEKIKAVLGDKCDTTAEEIVNLPLQYHKDHIRALSPSKKLAFVASAVPPPPPPRNYFLEVAQVGELKQMVTASATQPGVQVINVRGIPGTGKQTMCNHVAQHFITQCKGDSKDRLFDVVLWADDNLESALSDMADMLHIKGRKGMSQKGRAREVVEVLRKTPLCWLLVAINVEKTALHSLPTSVTGDASGGCVLATSSERLDVANVVDVAEWSDEDKVQAAAELTGMALPAEAETRVVLESATKGLTPHGVAVAAADVRERVGLMKWDTLDAWKRIADDPSLVDAHNMIHEVIRELSADDRELLCLFSVLPVHTIPTLPFQEKQLLRLARKFLVVFDTQHAFHMHHAVREAAAANLTVEEQTKKLRTAMDMMVASAPTLTDLEIGAKDKLTAARLVLPHMASMFETFHGEGGEKMVALGEWVAYALDRAKSRPTESQEMWVKVADMATEVTKRNLFRARAAHMEMLADKTKAAEILKRLGDIGAGVTEDSSADEMRTALQRTFILREVMKAEEAKKKKAEEEEEKKAEEEKGEKAEEEEGEKKAEEEEEEKKDEKKQSEAEMLYGIIGAGKHTDSITRGRANYNLALVWKGRGEEAKGNTKSQWFGAALEKLEKVVPDWKDNGKDTCLSLEGEANVAKLMVLKGKADEHIAEEPKSDAERNAKVMVQKGVTLYKDVVKRSEEVMGPEDRDTLLTKFFCAKFTGKHGDKTEAIEMMRDFSTSFSKLYPAHKKLKEARKKIAEWKAKLSGGQSQ